MPILETAAAVASLADATLAAADYSATKRDENRRERSQRVRAFCESVLSDPPEHLTATFALLHGSKAKVIIAYLGSPEGKSFVKLFVDVAAAKKLVDHRDTLVRLAHESLRMRLDPRVSKATSRRLVELLSEVIEASLRIAVDKAHAPAAPTPDYLLALIATQIELLSNQFALGREELIDKWTRTAATYRTVAAKTSAYLEPPNFAVSGARLLVPFNELYISPTLIDASPAHPQARPRTFSSDIIQGTGPRAVVVLGDPGAGKSSLLQWITLSLSSSEDANALLPILVPLREYEHLLQSDPDVGIADFIRHHWKVALSVRVHEDELEYSLAFTGILVLFDGLDELVDPKRRRDMSDRIVAFLSRYPNVRSVVTSRTIGYQAAALPSSVFEQCWIAPFDSRQVESYARKWFRVGATGNELAKNTELAESFVNDSEHVLELRSNPLLLALMCIMYRRQRHIPETLPEIYQYCSEMLFRSWDEYRDVRGLPRFTGRIRRILAAVAYWMYDRGLNEVGVSEADLRARILREVLRAKSEDEDSARELTDAFLAHCRERAWVFKDVGRSDYSERRFAFVHRSFLQYFAAVHLKNKANTPAKMVKVVMKAVDTGTYDLVTFMFLQLADVDADDVAWRIIERARIGDTAGTEFLIEASQYAELHDSIMPEIVRCSILSSLTGSRLWTNIALESALRDRVDFRDDAEDDGVLTVDDFDDDRDPGSLAEAVLECGAYLDRLYEIARLENRRALILSLAHLVAEIVDSANRLSSQNPFYLALISMYTSERMCSNWGRDPHEQAAIVAEGANARGALSEYVARALVEEPGLVGAALCLGVCDPADVVQELGPRVGLVSPLGEPFGPLSPIGEFVEDALSDASLKVGGFLGALLFAAALERVGLEFLVREDLETLRVGHASAMPAELNDGQYESLWHRVPLIAVAGLVALLRLQAEESSNESFVELRDEWVASWRTVFSIWHREDADSGLVQQLVGGVIALSG